MIRYCYEIHEMLDEMIFGEMKIGDHHFGGVVADGVGGLNDEMLVVVAYEIEDENG